jgi:BASS family bile acid:Na+ symporter
MNFLQLLPTLLVGALALIMFGLGLSLRVADFRRLLGYPKVVVIALLLQTVVLPAACYLLAIAFGLPPLFAIGLLLLAASPGGVTANLFSHLFGGNVALNISLTAINTVLAIVTLPLIANLAIAAFGGAGGQVVPLQFAKVAEVVAVVLIPVAIGMAVAAKKPAFAARMDKPFKLLSIVVLVALVVIAIVKEWAALAGAFTTLGPAVLTFNVLSLVVGYFGSRAAGIDKPLATAIAFEIGVHNSTLAIYVALSVLGSVQLALPAAIYSICMYFTAALFGLLISRHRRAPSAVAG